MISLIFTRFQCIELCPVAPMGQADVLKFNAGVREDLSRRFGNPTTVEIRQFVVDHACVSVAEYRNFEQMVLNFVDVSMR